MEKVKTVRYLVIPEKETEKALLVYDGDEKKNWVPKSQIKPVVRFTSKLGQNIEMFIAEIPKWLIDRNAMVPLTAFEEQELRNSFIATDLPA
jgi:hypothetical protein